MIAGYSKILLLLGRNEQKIEDFKVTQFRLLAYEKLRLRKKATVGELLREMNCTATGGSHKTISAFFHSLADAGMIKREKVGRRVYFIYEQ